MKIRRNDNVLVVAGKERGKKGKVHKVYPVKGRVVIEGLNMIKRHMKPRGVARQAGIVEREAPIDMSNVMLICPKCNQPARVGFHMLEDGAKARMCRRCKEVVD